VLEALETRVLTSQRLETILTLNEPGGRPPL